MIDALSTADGQPMRGEATVSQMFVDKRPRGYDITVSGVSGGGSLQYEVEVRSCSEKAAVSDAASHGVAGQRCSAHR